MAYLTNDELRALGLPGETRITRTRFGYVFIFVPGAQAGRHIGAVLPEGGYAQGCTAWIATVETRTIATTDTLRGAIRALIEYEQRGQGA